MSIFHKFAPAKANAFSLRLSWGSCRSHVPTRCSQYHLQSSKTFTNNVGNKTFYPRSVTLYNRSVASNLEGRRLIIVGVQTRDFQLRPASTKQQVKESKSSALSETRSEAELTVGAKVVQAGKDVTYTGVVVVGLIVTGLVFFAIGRELLSGDSPSGIYNQAFKMCKANDDVYVLLGAPLKAYGETSRRGRRRFTSHTEFIKDDIKHMRMKFYIEGPSKKGTVHLEAKQDERGKYQFRYIFVEAENGLRGPIIVLDER